MKNNKNINKNNDKRILINIISTIHAVIAIGNWFIGTFICCEEPGYAFFNHF